MKITKRITLAAATLALLAAGPAYAGQSGMGNKSSITIGSVSNQAYISGTYWEVAAKQNGLTAQVLIVSNAEVQALNWTVNGTQTLYHEVARSLRSNNAGQYEAPKHSGGFSVFSGAVTGDFQLVGS